MDKSIIIQKQIRDNADELHSFMRDLTNWEKEMKRKENLLHGEASQDIPPIRKKTKTSKPANETENVSPSQNPPENKPKKIASYDYRAWDKLDVLIHANKAVIENKESDVVNQVKKKMCWEHIAEMFNSQETHENKRTASQLIKFWDNEKTKRKRILTNAKLKQAATPYSDYCEPNFSGVGQNGFDRELESNINEMSIATTKGPPMIDYESLGRRSHPQSENGECPTYPSASYSQSHSSGANPMDSPYDKKPPATSPSEAERRSKIQEEMDEMRRQHEKDMTALRLEEMRCRVELAKKEIELKEKHVELESKKIESLDSEDSGEEGKKTKVQKKSGSKSVPAKSPVTPTNASSTKSEISSNSGKSQEKNSKSGNEFVTAGEWNEAIRMYSNAINLYPVDSVFYANRALCYLKLQRYKDAQYDCDTALTHNDQYVKAYLRRAAAFENQGKYELAQKDFRTVLKFEPNNRAAKDGLASVHKKITSQNCTSNISSESKVKPPGCGSVKEKMLCTEGSKVTAVTPSESKIFEANKEEALVVRTWKSEENDPRVLMETKPLKRVKIEEVYCDYESPLKTNGKNLLPSKEKQATVSIPDSNSSAHKSVVSGKIQEIKADTSVLSQTSVKAELMEELKITSPKLKENQPVVKAETKVTEMGSVQNPENIDIPRIPISYVGFSNSWSLMQNEPEKRYLYLKCCEIWLVTVKQSRTCSDSDISELRQSFQV
ncbi:unnamed protein product [Bemisia tabaci]|uniref:Regulatory protein zeste n=1 Tax=Bemisia tabaci TaxID=7038 RepID=A0A9P0FA83_BEMTA|nr:unnamed protein product [Bemisia tabaci]